MISSDVIAGLFVAGVTLHLVDGEIHYRAPGGSYGVGQRALVAAHRAGITELLATHGSAAPWRAMLDEVATWPAHIQTVLAGRVLEIEAGPGVSRADAEVRAFSELRGVALAPVVSVALAAVHGIGAVAFADGRPVRIGRPGPASADDDAHVTAAILRRHGARPISDSIGAEKAGA